MECDEIFRGQETSLELGKGFYMGKQVEPYRPKNPYPKSWKSLKSDGNL